MVAAFFTVIFIRVPKEGASPEKSINLLDAPEVSGMKELRETFNEDAGSLKLCFKDAFVKIPAEKMNDQSWCKDHEKELNKVLELYRNTPAQELKCDLSFPLLLDGCQGEGCNEYNVLRANADTSVVDSPLTANVIGKISKGFETKDVLEFKILVKEPGRVRALDSIEGEGLPKLIRMGYAFSTLSYMGEGFLTGCIGKQSFPFDADKSVETLNEEVAQDWVKIKLSGTQAGYVPYTSFENIGNENDGE